MANPSDPFSILNRNPDRGTFNLPKPKAKVVRYIPGKAPVAEDREDEENDEYSVKEISHYTFDNDKLSVADSQVTSREEEQALADKLARRRKIHSTVVIEEAGKDEKKEERPKEKPPKRLSEIKHPEVVERRARINKEKLMEKEEEVHEDDILLQKIQEEDETAKPKMEEEEETTAGVTLLKPVFVSKKERENKDVRAEEEIALQEEEKRLKEKRKLETKMMLIEVKKADTEKEEEKNESEEEMPNDADDIDEANEYELWKIRELKRIKRDREERLKREIEKTEIERRRKLTDAERAYENKVLGSDSIKPEKKKYKFMQKYYHRGAFFQDSEDPIFKRDYNEAVGEDLWDKSMLPKILQKRRGDFGKKGGTKYTHLTDQDTTNFDPQWKVNEAIQQKNLSKLGGYKGANVLDRPSLKKK